MASKPHVAQRLPAEAGPTAVDDPSMSVLAEATRLLGVYGEMALKAEQHANALQEQIDLQKRLHQGVIDSLVHAGKAALAELQEFCEEHKAELLPGDLKHAPLLYGKVGWRTPPPSVRTARGFNAEKVISALRKLRKHNCVRIVAQLDKPAILAASTAGDLSSVDLKNAGLKIVQGRDNFEVDLDHRQILKLITG